MVKTKRQSRARMQRMVTHPHEQFLSSYFQEGNSYLNQLLLPEESDKIVAIPDEFSAPTHVARIVTQVPFSTDDGFINGEMAILARPSLEKCLVTTRGTNGAATSEITTPDFTEGSGGRLIAPPYFDSSSDLEEFPAEYANTSIVVAGSGSSISGPFAWSYSSTGQRASQIVPALEMYKLPYRTYGTYVGTNQPILEFTLQKYNDPTTINAYYKYATGLNDQETIKVSEAIDISAVPANTSYRVVHGFTTSVSETRYITEFGFESVDVGSVLLRSVVARCERPNYGETYCTRAYDIGDDSSVLTALKTIGASARIVACSIWVQYTGSALSNGRIMGAFLNDGSDPYVGWKANEKLGTLPSSYSGQLNKGMYGWYKPVSREDYLFRPLSQLGEGAPFFAGFVQANEAAAESVNIRMVTVVEIRCTNPVFGPKPSPVAPQLRDQAQMILAYLPQVMENEAHLEKLKTFVLNALKKVGGAARFLNPLLQTGSKMAAPLSAAGPEGAILASLLTGSARLSDLLSKL